MAETTFLDRPATQVAMGGLARALEILPHSNRQISVLTYHRVEPTSPTEPMPSSLSVTPEAFREQMDTIARRTNPVTMDAVLEAFAERTPLPPRAVLVTFDDAYECIQRHAWPTLHELRIPATMFVPTRFPDSGRAFWWDRLHRAVANATGDVPILGRRWFLEAPDERRSLFAAIRSVVVVSPHDEAMKLVDDLIGQLKATEPATSDAPRLPVVSSWDDLRTMAEQGLSLGAHTRHHPLLTTIPVDRLEEELVGSLAELRLFAGAHARPVFAYPGGAHNPVVAGAVGRAGFKLAFTTDRGVVNTEDADPLLLTRINVGHHTAVNTVRVQLHPITHRVRQLAAIHPNRHRSTGSTRGRTSWN
ncbi:MAG: polysaccharide deacetylase family protein [Aquihabitans sp.]